MKTETLATKRDPLAVRLPMFSSSLSPNGRVHYLVRARAIRYARRQATLLAKKAMMGCGHFYFGGPPRWTHATATTEVYLSGARRRQDPGNVIAALKPYIDGLVDADVLVDDRHLQFGDVTFHRTAEKPYFIITITER